MESITEDERVLLRGLEEGASADTTAQVSRAQISSLARKAACALALAVGAAVAAATLATPMPAGKVARAEGAVMLQESFAAVASAPLSVPGEAPAAIAPAAPPTVFAVAPGGSQPDILVGEAPAAAVAPVAAVALDSPPDASAAPPAPLAGEPPQGAPAAQPSVSAQDQAAAAYSAPYDCEAGFSNWEAGWAEDKKAWCCREMMMGCSPTAAASEPFDCSAGAANADAGWSPAKKDWCCANKNVGCAAANAAPESAEPTLELVPEPTAEEIPDLTPVLTAEPDSDADAEESSKGAAAEEQEEQTDDEPNAASDDDADMDRDDEADEEAVDDAEQVDDGDDENVDDADNDDESDEDEGSQASGACVEAGDDCSKSQCCTDEGHQCYQKNKYYATCKITCKPNATDPGDPEKEPWSCKKLGERVPISLDCSWAGKDCGETKCCNNPGFTCAVKDELFTGCTQTVKHNTWFDEEIPMPEGWDGTEVGGSRSETEVAPAAGAAAGTSLYCFMAILYGSPEEELLKVAEDNQASIFGCEGHDVFPSEQVDAKGWDSGEATLVNTEVFFHVWDKVKEAEKYLEHDWTIKVDADCVFFADRMKSHLEALSPPADTPIYIKNNGMDAGMGNNGFLGAVEIFSTMAVLKYFDNAEGCQETLGTDAGEDGFFKGCMDALGVGFMLDVNIFNPDYSPGACADGDKVAFHPIKKAHDWQCCQDIANGIDHFVEYGECKD